MTNDDNTVCLFNKTGETLCLPVQALTFIQNILKQKYKLVNTPTIHQIKHILGIKNKIEIPGKIKSFLTSSGYDKPFDTNFKIPVPIISKNGLSGLNVIQILDKLMVFYKEFHYRGPCLLDYENSTYYNFSDLNKYPLFNLNEENNIPQFEKYYILLLNIPLSYNGSGHWTGLFIYKNYIFYYDPLNELITKEFQQLINTFSIYLKYKYGNVYFWRNNKKTQFSGKHCGVFQIHFVVTMLELSNKNNLIKSDKSINTTDLSNYLQDNLKQEFVEKQVSNYFYIDY